MRRVAVVGSGIAGLASAWRLSSSARVTLFEAADWFGGHAHTVDVRLEGRRCGVDTGFLVFNEPTYPLLTRLFAELGVQTAASDMSFSVQSPATGWEWCGSDLDGVFAQRSNLVSPRFWSMLADIVRFNRIATALAERGGDAGLDEPIGAFLDRHRFGRAFRDGYFLPMIGCIWSCPTDQMLRFPVGTMIRFCHNHGLIRLRDRPQWRTVRGGSRHYVQAMLARVAERRLSTPVTALQRRMAPEGERELWLTSRHGRERFDAVVLACHTDQALALLGDGADGHERALLGAIRWQLNRLVLHTDVTQLPRRRRAWAAWNYERAADRGHEEAAVCLHYLLNRLQPLPWKAPLVASLNPVREPRDDSVIGQWNYAHPVFDAAAVRAQRELHLIQGRAGVWFCGAWTRYGFHEDGAMSGFAVADAILAQWQREGDAAAADVRSPVAFVAAA